MSYLPPSEGGYFEAIQVFFTEITGRAVLFGARDQELLSRWKTEGRSAQVVCRGIREAVLSLKEGDPPRSLRECEGFVDQQWEQAREQMVGGQRAAASVQGAAVVVEKKEEERGAERGVYEEVSEALVAAGSQAEEERFKEAYREGWRELQRLRRETEGFCLFEVEALDQALVEAYLRTLTEGEREELERTLNEANPGLLRGMSPAARREHLLARRKRLLVSRYGLLDLLEILSQ